MKANHSFFQRFLQSV